MGPVDCYPLIEIDRVIHSAKLTLASPNNQSVELVDATWSPRHTTDTFLDRLSACLIVLLSRRDSDFFAPLFICRRGGCPRGNMSDDRRHIVAENNQHLLGQVHLGVIGRCVRPARQDLKWVLHPTPHLCINLARDVVPRHTHHQFFESPYCLASSFTKDPIGFAWIKVQFDQAILDHFDLRSSRTFANCLREWNFDNW